MLKSISNLGKELNKTEQESISGGGLTTAVRCNSPYFVSDGVCEAGDHPHPVYGHCVCCQA